MAGAIQDIIQGKRPLIHPGRSGQWPTVERNHLKEHPACAVCGSTKKVNVHHIHPFHTNPELELDPTNLITLCECGKYGVNCHLWIGHLGNFRCINPDSVTDADVWFKKLQAIKAGEKSQGQSPQVIQNLPLEENQ